MYWLCWEKIDDENRCSSDYCKALKQIILWHFHAMETPKLIKTIEEKAKNKFNFSSSLWGA